MCTNKNALQLVHLLISAACSTPAPDIAQLTDASGVDAIQPADEAGGPMDAPSIDASLTLPACAWPTPLDAGPGACRVGRFHLECTYPSGVTFDDGTSWTSPTGPVGMLCASGDPTGCPGAHPIAGTASCRSKCAPVWPTVCGG